MRLPRSALVFLALVWVLVILYPDPGLLVRSVRNLVSPQIEAAAVAHLAARLPDDPANIETFVRERQVPYAYDWQSAGVPWYFPTTSEAVRAGRGDCESRALVLASLLTAKGIANELRASLDHMWVDYPGKRENAIENASVEVLGREDGRFFLHWPADFDLGEELADQVAIYWTPAPVWRVLLLVAGLSLLVLWNALVRLGDDGGGARLDLCGPVASAPAARRPGSGAGRRLCGAVGLATHPRQV